jgi:hypothetical protein
MDMSKDDGTDEHGIDWLCGCHLVGFWLGSYRANHNWFCHVLTTNLTQHDSHGPDDHPKTIDYHHMDMSKDDGTDDMHGIDWLCGCHLVRVRLGSWANHSWFLSSPDHKSDPAWLLTGVLRVPTCWMLFIPEPTFLGLTINY